MLTSDAPQWFLRSFVRSAVGAGATADTDAIETIGQSLLERWADENRHFHNLRHLASVLHRVDELAEETHEPDLVRLAAWYHGAVFNAERKVADASQGGEQTTASAVLAHEELIGLGVPTRAAARVAALVNAIVRHAPDPTDFDAAVLNDADLAMLAAEPQRYKDYKSAVRAEYAHIPAEDYLRARIRVIERLLARRSLFLSPMGAAWEEPARQNLDMELHRLRKEQAKLGSA
ncbi:putative metal-dependent HD superfamily phosphohydrolase [Promicromonospora sukumoe]|uniref:Putative metal-dependent HD superfamily phosphohydrolase n=1 Tax=Promicromonospora sukumoe TaxID=88382 RepID=A0A7W3JCN0_9MICO|nr:putative metal-dependent HD superfamily phosphohydrolase [Promicromonospora sukumoe]